MATLAPTLISPFINESLTDWSFIPGQNVLSVTDTSSPAFVPGIIDGYKLCGLVKSNVVSLSCVSANEDKEKRKNNKRERYFIKTCFYILVSKS